MNVEKLSLIGRKRFKYNDDIIINIPTVRQIRDEDYEGVSFWKETNLFTQTPSDMISELDSVNIDFEEISDYELFIFLFLMNKKIENPSKCMLFTNFSFWNLEVCEINGISCLSDENGKVIINESVYNDISKIITMITGHEKTKKKKFGKGNVIRTIIFGTITFVLFVVTVILIFLKNYETLKELCSAWGH